MSRADRIRRLAWEYLEWLEDRIELLTVKGTLNELSLLLFVESHWDSGEFEQVLRSLWNGDGGGPGDEMCCEYVRAACSRLVADPTSPLPAFDWAKWQRVRFWVQF